jgi:hypothetical protein
MREGIEKIEDLTQEETARLVLNMLHRVMIHYGLWFVEVDKLLGEEKALEIIKLASQRSYEAQMPRFAEGLGFQMKDGIPKPLLEMPRESLMAFLDTIAKNWLANDGVWFQAVEFTTGMAEAKHCNDSCWTKFSPVEAWSIKEFLGLPKEAGLNGLKKGLAFRIYARINVQSVIDESPTSIVFQMNECRVQSARKRRGLPDYPCKSAGLVEYTHFARAMDSRITTECIGCPPDPHPEEWYCAWRFRLTGKG